MDKKLIIVLGVFLTVVLCVAALYIGDLNHEEIPFKSIDDPDVQSQVLESIMENSDLVLTIETTDSVTIKPATVRHSVSYNTGITTVTIFDYIGQKFHVVVGDSSDVYLFGVTDKKEYDKESKTVTIINDTSKKPKMTIKLLSSEPDICTFTEIFEVTNFEMYTPDSDLDFKARSVVQKGRNSVFKTEWFIEVNQSYVVNITDYKATQVKKEVYNNKTGKNETIFVNETVISGYHDETRYRNVWSDYNKYGTKLAKNTIQKIKVVYHKKPELGDVRIQTIPLFRGVECDELTWWNTSWNYRRNITIDHAKVAADETNFPVMVSITQLGLNTDGNDTRITDSSDNQVAVDPECYNATSGELVFFFNGTSISSTVNTSFWMYYNNSAATEPAADSTYGSEAVWGGYSAVYHMNGVGSLVDSTSNSNDGTTYGNPTLVDGTYGKKIEFDGNDYFDVVDDTTLDFNTMDFDILMIVKSVHGSTIHAPLLAKLDPESSGQWTLQYASSVCSGYFNFREAAATRIIGNVNMHDSTEHIIQFHRESGTFYWDVDNINKNSATVTRNLDNTALLSIGRRSSGYGDFDGDMTEIRIIKDTLSSNFRTTTYNNLNNPTATGTAPFFASFGAEDSVSMITEYTPATPLDKNGGESQLFTVNTSENSQCRWYINGSLMQTNSTGATRHEYLNSSLEEGYWNFTAVANTTGMTSSQTWWVTVHEPPSIPPDPVSLTNTTGNFWIRHAWSAGSGNITDGYNVSVNDTWYNTSNTFINLSKSPRGYQNITVHAWNATGITTMSSGYLSENVTLANNPVTLTNYSLLYSIQEFDTVSIDFDYTDADGDIVVFGTNAVNGTFDNATGLWSWTTTWMDRSVNQWTFNVSDGYGSVDSITIEIEVTAYPITDLSENWQYHDSDDISDEWVSYTLYEGAGSSASVSLHSTGSPDSKAVYLYTTHTGSYADPIASTYNMNPSISDYWAFVVRDCYRYTGHANDWAYFKIYFYDIEGYEINNYDLTSYATANDNNDLWELTRMGDSLYLKINGDTQGIIGSCDDDPAYIKFYCNVHEAGTGANSVMNIHIDDITTSTAINGIDVDHSDAPQYDSTHTWADSELWIVPPTITTTYGLKTTPVADYTDAEYTMKVQRVLTSEYVNTTIIKPAGEAPNSTQKPCGSVSLDQPTLFGDNYGVYNFLIDKDGSTIATDYIYWMNMEVSGNSYVNVADPTYPAGAQIVPSYFIDNINLVEYKYYIKTLSLFGTQMAVSSDLLVDTSTVSVDTTGYDATSYWCVLVRESRSDGVAVEMASDMFAITNSITIGGTVYDAENGTPLGDAKVALYQNGLWYNTTSNTTTGEYSLDDLTADVAISVNVTHPGYIHDDYTFTPLVAGVIPIDIYMLQEDPGVTYTGTAIGGLVLYAPYHQALNGATANLWNSTWNDNTTSSSTGYYLFDDIANGTFTGNAAMSGYSSASNEDVTTSLGAYTYQNYLLQPLNILTVKAKDTSTHATIMTFSAVFEEDTTYETTDGFVNITAGIGIYKVEVTAEGYYTGIDYATVVSDTELVLYLVPIDETGQGTYYDYHYVEFIVSDEGTRCAGVNTTVYLATNGTALQNGITGTNGGVVFELSEDVLYTLTFINESQSIDKTITLYPIGNLYYIYINESYTFDPGNVSTELTNYSTTNTSREWAIHNLTNHDLNSTIGLGVLGQGIVASTVVWCIVGAGGPAAAFAAIAAMAALGIVTWILVLFCGMTAVSLYILGGKIR